MMERIFTVVLGDWSDDGHGKTSTYYLKLTGDDVSDERLNAGLRATNAQMGVELFSIASSYEENSISRDLGERLYEAGFRPGDCDDEIVWVEDMEEDEGDFKTDFSVLDLIPWWIGRDIPNFSWELVETGFPTLLGGFDTVLKTERELPSTSFGYGLFMA